MDLTNLTNQILALLAVVSTISGVIITILNANATLKKSNLENKRSESNLGIEATERLNTVGLSIITTQERQMKVCEDRRIALEKQVQETSLEITDLKIRVKKLALSLREIVEKHNDIIKESGGCKGAIIINNMILSIIDEIDKEVDV